MPVRRLMRRFARISNLQRLLLVEAVLALALARLALLVVPFRVLASGFGSLAVPGDAAPPLGEPPRARDIRAIGWAVTRAARYVPFRAVCLPQAIAAKSMLNRRRIGSVMHFGVAKASGAPLAAHAWLDAGRIEVTGYPVGPDFVEVARFV